MMTQALNDQQLIALLAAAPALDRIMPSLPQEMQQQFMDLEVRAAHAYNSGTWTGQESGDVFVNPIHPAPTREQAQVVLGQAYLVLQDQQTTLKNLMNEMELTPLALRQSQRQVEREAEPKSWVEQAVENVKGWFR